MAKVMTQHTSFNWFHPHTSQDNYTVAILLSFRVVDGTLIPSIQCSIEKKTTQTTDFY